MQRILSALLYTYQADLYAIAHTRDCRPENTILRAIYGHRLRNSLCVDATYLNGAERAVWYQSRQLQAAECNYE